MNGYDETREPLGDRHGDVAVLGGGHVERPNIQASLPVADGLVGAGSTCASGVAGSIAVRAPCDVAQPLLDPPVASCSPPVAAARPALLMRVWRNAASAAEFAFGLSSLLVILAVAATFPILQFLSLGYLLEVAGRVARNGRLKFGFFGVRQAARVGGIALGAYLVLLPLELISSMVTAARLIEPGSAADRGWTAALVILAPLALLHIVGAIWRGGRLRHFLWPAPVAVARMLFRASAYVHARDAVYDFILSLRLPYFFWLGVRGFVGGFVWLSIPITLLAAGRRYPGVGYLGGLMLMIVLLYLPFLQAHFAASNRFAAMFDIAEVRRLFRRAPWAFFSALAVSLTLAVPLYLLKIELVPHDAAWILSLAFVGFMFPTRVATGWAYGYAKSRPRMRHWFWRWTARLAMLPLAAAYVLIVFFTQYTSWRGVWSLYEQHAFLLPVPYLGS